MAFNSSQSLRYRKSYICSNSYLKRGVLPKSIRIKNKKKKVKTLREMIVQILKKIFKINI